MPSRKVRLGDREVNATEVPFEVEREPWITYILEDGSTLKVKTVLAEVLRVEGEWTPSGDPLYIVNASPVISTVAPERLRRP